LLDLRKGPLHLYPKLTSKGVVVKANTFLWLLMITGSVTGHAADAQRFTARDLFEIKCRREVHGGNEEYRITRYDFVQEDQRNTLKFLSVEKTDAMGVHSVVHVKSDRAIEAEPVLHRGSLVYRVMLIGEKNKTDGWIYLHNIGGERFLLDINVPHGALVNTGIGVTLEDAPCQIKK